MQREDKKKHPICDDFGACSCAIAEKSGAYGTIIQKFDSNNNCKYLHMTIYLQCAIIVHYRPFFGKHLKKLMKKYWRIRCEKYKVSRVWRSLSTFWTDVYFNKNSLCVLFMFQWLFHVVRVSEKNLDFFLIKKFNIRYIDYKFATVSTSNNCLRAKIPKVKCTTSAIIEWFYKWINIYWRPNITHAFSSTMHLKI